MYMHQIKILKSICTLNSKFSCVGLSSPVQKFQKSSFCQCLLLFSIEFNYSRGFTGLVNLMDELPILPSFFVW